MGCRVFARQPKKSSWIQNIRKCIPRDFKLHLFACYGMRKCETWCKKRNLSVIPTGTVFAVPQQGMPTGGKLNAYLVCSARVQ